MSNDAQLLLVIGILVFLFGGDPDFADALVIYLMK